MAAHVGRKSSMHNKPMANRAAKSTTKTEPKYWHMVCAICPKDCNRIGFWDGLRGEATGSRYTNLRKFFMNFLSVSRN